MAAASARFSIRDYTARMRSVDMGKCWPFGGGRGGGGGEELPPMAPQRKFGWWVDELEAVGSRRDAETRELGGREPAGTGVVAVENAGPGEAESPVALEEVTAVRAPTRSRLRPPKKRSISELFAAGERERDHEGEEGGLRAEKGKMKEGFIVAGDGETGRSCMNKQSNKSDKKKKVKKKKKKKKKKIMVAGISDTARKDKFGRLNNMECDGKIKGKCKRRVGVPRKKPQKKKCLQEKDDHYLESMLPLHGILKKRRGSTSDTRKNAMRNSRDSDLISLCRKSVKRVSFSGVEDMFQCEKHISSMMWPRSQQRLCKPASGTSNASCSADNSGENDIHDPPETEESRAIHRSDRDTSTCAIGGTDEADLRSNRSRDHVDHSRAASDANRKSFSGSMDLNDPVQEPNLCEINCSLPRTTSPLQETEANNGRIPEFLLNNDLCQPCLANYSHCLSDSMRFTDPSVSANPPSYCRDSEADHEETVGLPLNSKGGLINSCSDSGLKHQYFQQFCSAAGETSRLGSTNQRHLELGLKPVMKQSIQLMGKIITVGTNSGDINPSDIRITRKRPQNEYHACHQHEVPSSSNHVHFPCQPHPMSQSAIFPGNHFNMNLCTPALPAQVFMRGASNSVVCLISGNLTKEMRQRGFLELYGPARVCDPVELLPCFPGCDGGFRSGPVVVVPQQHAPVSNIPSLLPAFSSPIVPSLVCNPNSCSQAYGLCTPSSAANACYKGMTRKYEHMNSGIDTRRSPGDEGDRCLKILKTSDAGRLR